MLVHELHVVEAARDMVARDVERLARVAEELSRVDNLRGAVAALAWRNRLLSLLQVVEEFLEAAESGGPLAVSQAGCRLADASYRALSEAVEEGVRPFASPSRVYLVALYRVAREACGRG